MQYSGGTASLNSYGDSEWESSFTQILSRTKQNLNRINQRYSSTSTSLSLPSSSSLSKAWSSDATFPADREVSGATVPSSSFLSDGDRNFLSKGNPAQHVATNSSPLFLSNGRDNVPSTLNMQADQEQKLLERLSEKLLSQLGHGIGLAQGGSREEVETLRTKVRLLSESNESLEKEMRGLQSKLFACTGAIESLTAAQRERERERDREKESGRLTYPAITQRFLRSYIHTNIHAYIHTHIILILLAPAVPRTWNSEQARKLGSTGGSLAGADGGETQWFVTESTLRDPILVPVYLFCVYVWQTYE